MYCLAVYRTPFCSSAPIPDRGGQSDTESSFWSQPAVSVAGNAPDPSICSPWGWRRGERGHPPAPHVRLGKTRSYLFAALPSSPRNRVTSP